MRNHYFACWVWRLCKSEI